PAADVHLGDPVDHDVHGVTLVAPLHDGLPGFVRHPLPDRHHILEVPAVEPGEQWRAPQRRTPDRPLVHVILPPPLPFTCPRWGSVADRRARCAGSSTPLPPRPPGATTPSGIGWRRPMK